MFTLNTNPHLMLQLATTTRADQIEGAERRRAHAGAHSGAHAGARRRASGARLGGYWGGLRRRSEHTAPAPARTV
ncbi:hypothetical protein [Humibacillus xanthopallidus]|uniref:Uncharacterized protein n=1 Tax=Humibacillus xanthopallidus TaxID=412689 RepID=A0A543I2K2_9MICO|nr:hypothetical protein [Humibacillus xanthopallidus]TQM64700.1 hypothetical protein FBY41_1078 [Humibacillus xanthopallidus]